MLVGCSVMPLLAAAPGSNRPIAQRNFQQLIESNSCPGCDLAGVVLTRVDLSGANLEGANLAGAKLFLADLSHANLRSANLQSASLGGADLAGADLTGANLTGAILEGAYMKGAITDGVLTNKTATTATVENGELVVVPEQSQSKSAPYSQDMVIESRRDFEESPPNVEAAVPVNSTEVRGSNEKYVEVSSKSKQPVRMADAVISSTASDEAVITEKEKNVTEKLVEVEPTVDEKTTKESVVTEKKEVTVEHNVIPSQQEHGEEISPTPGEHVVDEDGLEEESLDKDSKVKAMIDQIEVDNTVKATTSVVAETPDRQRGQEEQAPVVQAPPKDGSVPLVSASQKERESQGEGAKDMEAKAPQASVQPIVEPIDSAQDSEESMTREETPASVHAMVESIEQDAQGGTQKVGGALVYSVETPDHALAVKQAQIEKLLDDDRCVECDLPGVDLSGKRLQAVDLERANLQGANLEGINLSESNLKGTNLSGANLRNADLSEADLYKADLTGADLTGADLSEALLDSAKLTGAVGYAPSLDGENK